MKQEKSQIEYVHLSLNWKSGYTGTRDLEKVNKAFAEAKKVFKKELDE